MKTKNLLLAVLFFISANGIYGQAPSWEWAKGAGIAAFTYHDQVITADANGNVYMAATYVDSVLNIGSFQLRNDSNGNGNGYFAKFDTHGNVIWAKNIDGAYHEYGFGITTDVNANVYLTGVSNSATVTIDTLMLINTNAGFGSFLFILKYDANGNLIWKKTTALNNSSKAPALATDNAGNLYLAGNYSYSIDLDSIALIDTVVATTTFIAKLNSNGNVAWAKSMRSPNNNEGKGIAIFGNSIFLTGIYTDTIRIDSVVLINNTGIWGSAFTIRLDTTGNAIWAKSGGGNYNVESWGCTTDANENVYVAGNFMGTELVTDTLSFLSPHSMNIFIAKYNKNGKLIWTRTFASNIADRCFGIASNSRGDVFVTGFYNSTIINFGNFTLTSPGGVSVFVVKLDSVGADLWAKSALGSGYQEGIAIAADENNDVFVSGYFDKGTILFDGIPLVSSDTGANYMPDNFLAKLSSTVSVKEILVQNFDIYPNPTSNKVSIVCNSSINHLTLTDLTGRLILEKSLTPNPLSKGDGAYENKIDIDVSGVAKGIYVVTVRDGEREMRGKVVVE